jgi:hypothetical protein
MSPFTFLDLSRQGANQQGAIGQCGDAYYIFQLWPVVREATSSLSDDFLSGKFAPPKKVRTSLMRMVTTSPGPNDERFAAGLEEIFADGVIESGIESFAGQLERFDRARNRTPLQRESVKDRIISFQRDLTARGGSRARLAVDALGWRVFDGVNLATQPSVQQHAGTAGLGDVPATLAALSGMPADEVRSRAVKASVIHRMSQLLAVNEATIRGMGDIQIINLGDPLLYWPGGGTAPERTVEGTVQDGDADRQLELVRRRRAAVTRFG